MNPDYGTWQGRRGRRGREGAEKGQRRAAMTKSRVAKQDRIETMNGVERGVCQIV